MLRTVVAISSFFALLGASQNTVTANIVLDGSFENQAVLQNTPFTLQPGGAKWGSSWPGYGVSSWQDNTPGVGVWTGGAIARTEEYAAGWKWAQHGGVFGIIKDRQTMSQSFTATDSGTGSLTWFDANRATWKTDQWFGRPNDYSVTLTDSFGTVQTLGNFTSQVAGGNQYSTPVGDQWGSVAGKSTWYDRSVSGFNMVAGMTYTLSFNSLSPYVDDGKGGLKIDDRTTFLDNINLTVASSLSPVPELGTLCSWSAICLCVGFATLRRRRLQAA